ncbi:hypothetical protein TNCV_661451 [Trichonephila clavipes]|nr:hypothetical protein TNCV_661451 [Trichonephila clavipes]
MPSLARVPLISRGLPETEKHGKRSTRQNSFGTSVLGSSPPLTFHGFLKRSVFVIGCDISPVTSRSTHMVTKPPNLVANSEAN